MPFSLQSFDVALICDGNELEAYGVKQEGPNSKSAFVASEAGKHFKFTYTNNLLDTDLRIAVYTDGVLAVDFMSPAGKQGQMLGIQKSCNSVLPFKFRELELVDLENAPVVLEMGMIELRAFRCPTEKYKRNDKSGLHRGRVSERSKMAGWHHVSTGDEIPIAATSLVHVLDEIDPPNAPHATIKVTYRPRELLIAQGVISGNSARAEISGGSGVNDRKRPREGGSHRPSKRRTGSTVKKEEISDDEQRIQALQAELNALLDKRSRLTLED